MILLRDVRGQDNAVRYLLGNLSSGRIAGSYLFYGPRGVGRALSAKAFIMALVCPDKAGEVEACASCSTCRRINTLEHPDVTWIKPEKNKAIKIDEIRKVKEMLNLKPYEASFGVCVIEFAHMMTIEAFNALLKVMEEPPGHSLMILITNKKELLPQTVVSRCTEVGFRPVPASDTKNIIMAGSDVSEETAGFLAHFSQGSPGRAMEMIEEGFEERKKDLIGMIDNIAGEKTPSCLNWNSEDKNRLFEDLEMLVMFFRDVAMGKEALKDLVLDKDIAGTEIYRFFGKYSMEKIYGIVERLIKMKLALAGNVNPKLVAQALPGMIKNSV